MVRIYDCGLERPICQKGGDGPANTTPYVTPSNDSPSCRKRIAGSSSVTDEVEGNFGNSTPGAGCLLAASFN